jgi:hypothetical protein
LNSLGALEAKGGAVEVLFAGATRSMLANLCEQHKEGTLKTVKAQLERKDDHRTNDKL